MTPKSPLASYRQLEFLESFSHKGSRSSFAGKLYEQGIHSLSTALPEILQVNVGYQCNQTCKHCHVDAGPTRKERMSRETLEDCLQALIRGGFNTLDITGGAPEMHQDFRWLVGETRRISDVEIIVRSNLTILLANPSFYDLPQFFRDHRVRVCSSLPFYKKDRTDRQRGEGVFEKSIRAIRSLNEVGYGLKDTGLELDLVHNPAGAFLPADQNQLEADFKIALERDHGIFFNRLLTITNAPVSRFLEFLLTSGNFESYMDKLIQHFNPATVSGLMCRTTVSVDWQGYLYDCDFNQMLGLKSEGLEKQHIKFFDPSQYKNRKIQTGNHCFACTAGSGSSCQGTTIA